MLKACTKLALFLVLTLFCGCDQQAIDFARKTKDILDQRSAQLANKIAAEKQSYNSSAVYDGENRRALVSLALLNERHERASALSVDYDEGRKPVSLWRKDLSEYAKIDYEENRKLLTEEMDANTRYLQTFQELQIEQDKVEALSKLLTTLSKNPSLKSDVSDLASFGEDTKQEFDEQVCSHLLSKAKGTDPAVSVPAKQAYCAKKCNDVLVLKEDCSAN